jgi:hypothetical protein
MSQRDDGKREAPISYRPPKELRAEFERRVLASGLAVSAFITKAWHGGDPPRRSRRPTVDHEAVAQVLAGLAQVRDALQVAGSNAGDSAQARAAIEQAVRPLTEMRAACFKALGRQP